MDDVRRHLAELAEEALVEGFDRVEFEREVREGIQGWRLLAGGNTVAAEKFVIEAALADDGESYTAELQALLRGWARSGIPVVDRVKQAEGLFHEDHPPLSDLAFLLCVGDRGSPTLQRIVLTLLERGYDVAKVAGALREAVEADEPA